ncbi:MAG: hypothetical protein ABI601_12740 [bacterium]
MKRLILAFVVAILAGTGVASATSVLRAKPAPVVADSSKHAPHDTTALRVVDASGGATPPAVHSVTPPTQPAQPAPAVIAAADAKAVPVGEAPHGTVAQQGSPVTVPPAKVSTSGQLPRSAVEATVPRASAAPAPADRRISRVFAAMAPRDAAKVLAQLTDQDIVTILGGLTEKQEAAILAQLPVDRLAAVSKLALRAALAGQ